MGEVVAALAVAALAVWFLLSVLNQVAGGRLLRRLRPHDALLLLPVWGYFSRLGVIDSVVLYRDRLAGGATTGWREHSGYRPGLLRPVWNPERRVRYGVYDACVRVLRAAARSPDRELLVGTLEYRALLNFVNGQPGLPGVVATARQFMLVDTVRPPGAGAKPAILFVSPFHPL